jgi:hypothetical protein
MFHTVSPQKPKKNKSTMKKKKTKKKKVKKSSSPVAQFKSAVTSAAKKAAQKISPRSVSGSQFTFAGSKFDAKWEQERKRAIQQMHNKLVKKLQAKGRVVLPMKGDGDCAPRAITHREDVGLTHRELRAAVAELMLEKPEHFFGAFASNHPDDQSATLDDYEAYVRRMMKKGAWFGEQEIKASALFLGRRILVWTPHLDDPLVYNGNAVPSGKDIELVYNGINHYDLVEKNDGGDMSIVSHPPSCARFVSQTALTLPLTFAFVFSLKRNLLNLMTMKRWWWRKKKKKKKKKRRRRKRRRRRKKMKKKRRRRKKPDVELLGVSSSASPASLPETTTPTKYPLYHLLSRKQQAP